MKFAHPHSSPGPVCLQKCVIAKIKMRELSEVLQKYEKLKF